jgi:hypothetical protein
MHATCPSHLIPLGIITLITLGEATSYEAPLRIQKNERIKVKEKEMKKVDPKSRVLQF